MRAGEIVGVDSAEWREQTVHVMAEAVSIPSQSDCLHWMGELYDAFMEDLASSQPGRFLKIWKQVIAMGRLSNFHASWQDVLSAMRGLLLPVIEGMGSVRRAESLWQQARVLIGEETLNMETEMRLQVEHRNVILREISEIFMTCHTLPELLDVIALEFPLAFMPVIWLSSTGFPSRPRSHA